MATTKRTTKYRKAATPKKRRTATPVRKRAKPNPIVSALIPLVLIVALLAGIVFLLTMGLNTVAASSIFDVKRIETKGNSRVSSEEVEKTIKSVIDKDGVWNADLAVAKTELEKLPYVKEAVVTRLLPDGIQAQIVERIPRAAARLEKGDLWWIDEEGKKVAPIGKNESRPPILKGWDEKETSPKDNAEKVRIYGKIREDIQAVGIEKRISFIDLSDPQDAVVAAGDSGETVYVSLGKEDFGKRFQTALTIIEGKGKSIESIKFGGGNPIASYREQAPQN